MCKPKLVITAAFEGEERIVSRVLSLSHGVVWAVIAWYFGKHYPDALTPVIVCAVATFAIPLVVRVIYFSVRVERLEEKEERRILNRMDGTLPTEDDLKFLNRKAKGKSAGTTD